MLLASFICLTLLFLIVFFVCVTEGFDLAGVLIGTMVLIPLITIIKLLFNI